jgi:hypothetical protein
MNVRTLLSLSFCLTSFAWNEMVAASPVSELKAVARDGQIFLTWGEAETPERTTFNVYVANAPITDLTKAERVGHHVEQHSARDWWEDPASFTKGVAPGKPVGWRLEPGGARLDPRGGLFVYTVNPLLEGGRLTFFFAVTSSDAEGHEDQMLTPRANTLTVGVDAVYGALRPIWQRDEALSAAGAGKGKPLWLDLHAKGGVIPNSEYLLFGDASMGWREGLPFKFSVRLQNDTVVVRPTDRVWINRPHDEARDGGMPAIWTFWYGYNSHIYDRSQMSTGVPTNYTEVRNLWILGWVRNQYQPDPNRWYCSGSSMGGCGTISFGLHHPELFAACYAHVPIVAYTDLGAKSEVRLEPSCWTGPIPADLKTNEGVPLLERMNSTRFVEKTTDDLPYLFILNGRQDGSIPWQNNPPFYRALAAMQQGFAAYWDNGTHATSGKDAPEDVKAWLQRFRRFRRDESYPVFTHTSTDRNPGNGAPDDGDIIGWINRGMDWKDIEDTSERYAITLLAEPPDGTYPVQTDVTLRRVQRFKTTPATYLRVRVGHAESVAVSPDTDGLITVRKVVILDKAGVRVVIERGMVDRKP